MTDDNKDRLTQLVNASGYAYQVGIEHQIDTSRDRHEWVVFSREHPWLDPESGTRGYIDLILGSGNQRIVAECKRTREANWVFLVPGDEIKQVERSRILWTVGRPGWAEASDWYDLRLLPASPESAFCAVRGSGDKDGPFLERACSKLLRSMECVAAEELTMGLPAWRFPMLYTPIIITTASLRVARFDPGCVSMIDGTMPPPEFTEVPMVRFRKSLTTTLSVTSDAARLEDTLQERERSVIIINSSHLIDCLHDWNYRERGTFEPEFPWLRLRGPS